MKKSMHVGPNMTPMVDVVMCILIFFMLGSSFAVTSMYLSAPTPAIDKKGLGNVAADSVMPSVQFTLEVKRVAGQTKVSAFGITVEKLDNEGADEGALTLPRLLTQKRQAMDKDVQLFIEPSRHVSWQDVILVYDACVKAKFQNVAFKNYRD